MICPAHRSDQATCGPRRSQVETARRRAVVARLGVSAVLLWGAAAALAAGCDEETTTTPTGSTAAGGSATGSGTTATGAGGAAGGGGIAGAGGGSDPQVDDDQDGFAEVDGDCDDGDPSVHPGQEEIAGNDKDDDCDGLSFGAEQSLGVQGQQLDVALEGNGDLHLTYVRNLLEVYYRRQQGGTWQSGEIPVPVAGTYHPWWWPRVGVDAAGTAHFAWADWQVHVWYTRYDGAFAPLSPAITDLEGAGGGADTNRNDLAMLPDGSVFIAAQSDFAIEYDVKPPAGSFGADTAIFTDPATEPQFPSITVSPVDGSVHCAYTDNESGAGLRYSHGSFSGSWTWSPSERPAGDGGGCCANASTITVDPGGRVHVAWIAWRSDEAQYSDLLYARKGLNGTWSSLKTFVSTPNYFSCLPGTDECNLAQIAAANNNTVLLVYANGGNHSELRYFVKFPGKPWTDQPTPVAFVDENSDSVNDGRPQNFPAVVAEGNTFHVLWSDGRGAIYHRTIEAVPTDPAPLPP